MFTDSASPMLRSTIRRRAAGASLALALALGCSAEELPLLPVVWEGQSIRVRMDDPGIEVCGGTFDALDRHAALVREALLLAGDDIIEYTIADQDLVDSVCASEASSSPDGCTYPEGGLVYTTVPYVPHELVHATRLEDPELRFLSFPIEEGLATLFGADSHGDQIIPLDALGIFAEDYVTGFDEYHRAGQTMAILLDLHGVEEFRRFELTARTLGEDRAFEDVFGESKQEFAETAEGQPHCEQSQWWAPLLECDGEPVTPDPITGAVTLTGNVDCAEADVRGPDFGRMWVSRHFRLDQRTSTLTHQFDMPDDATLEIVSCEGGCPERFAYIGTSDQVGGILNGLPDLEPGEYFLRMSRPVAEGGGQFEIVLR